MKLTKKSFVFVLMLFVMFLIDGIASADPGDGVYRNMDRWGCESTGHAGMDVGSNNVVHMEETGCYLENFSSSFSRNYWGSITQGNSKSAEARIEKAKNIFKQQPQYSFFIYKQYPSKFRCDGLVEYCFEKAGGDIVPDWGWATLSPYAQWISNKITRRNITALGNQQLRFRQ